MEQREEATSSVTPEQILDAVALMAHDIRGPLVSMAATVKLMLRRENGGSDGFMDGLYRKITRLIGITEDCMGKVSVLNGAVRIEPVELDLWPDVVEPVLEELAPEILESRAVMNRQTAVSQFRGVIIRGSGFWLKAVFRNLLSNAIKFGGRGCTIALGCRKYGSYCRCNLYNSGKPIPKELQDRLFTVFCNMHRNGGRPNEGVGMGLHLIQKVLQQHGGDIRYEPEAGGSNFVFTLPLTVQTQGQDSIQNFGDCLDARRTFRIPAREVHMRMKEVWEKAQSLGIKAKNPTKKDLIRMIQETEGNFDCFGRSEDYCDRADCCFRSDCLPGKN